MDTESEECVLKNFVPRDYQLELLEDVKKSNTILYLPTGSGKTYIATMLIKYMGENLNKPLGKGRKWTFFIVQSVPLVRQQANSIKKHLPWNIGTFSGDMNVDYWSKNEWDAVLDKCHILVMTAQIYLNNLHHGFMNIKDANLIVFDECHHAVSLHPFRQIMQIVHDTIFNDCKQPHILGLTATLINSNTKNVKEELTRLQRTYSATIKTKYDEAIKIFSARPKEFIYLYDEFTLDEELKAITIRIQLFNEQLRKIQSPNKNERIVENQETFYLEFQKSPSKYLANYFLDLEVNLCDSGVYVAYLASWHYIIEIEKKKKLCSDLDKYMVMSLALSEMTVIRKMIHDYMAKNSKHAEGPTSLLINASSKLKTLMQLLLTIKRSDVCLVFVDRRTTAKIIYHYINDYIHEHKHENIVCDFIVGAKGLFKNDSKEMMYKKQQNIEIIKKFNDKVINVLITSEVLEEGVDIQTCNYVVRYDTPKNFPSYVQSKGRARSSDSKFIVMVPSKIQFDKIQTEYVNMEKEIDKILVENDIDDDNNEENVDEVFKTKHAILTHDMAISIVNRYCSTLPQDRFSNLRPDWYIAENVNDFKKYKLKLPINSAIKTPIDGIFCKTKKNAKKAAAFNASIELYKAKALDENLLPVNIENKFLVNNSKWFPHWVEEDIEACKYNLKPGSNKMKRMVHIESPSYLRAVYPQIDKPSYLHVIHCDPIYSQLRDSNYETFDKLLRSNKEFGILTSKKIPSVSNFPIFLNFGDVNIQIKDNVDVIYLNHENHNRLEQFHNKLFVDVLGVKDFIIRSYNNENNSYLIVPIISSDNTYSVDWNVVDLNSFIETKPPTMAERKNKFYEEYLESSCVISPWYRNIVPLQRYIVTDVHNDMTPESSFPTCEYETYKKYFSEKYNIRVANKNQPMIKVKSLGVSKINYLIPRFSSGKIDKRSEYIEILIPEFCIWHSFPSVYWLKALMLPTILYRLSNLLLAAELLVKVNSLCNIILENKKIADAIEMDNFCGFNEQKKKKIILPISETLKYLENSHDNLGDEWNSNNLLIDIERQKNTTMLDVLNYHTFMYAMIKSKSDEKKKVLSSPTLNDFQSKSKNDIKIADSNQDYSDYKTKCKKHRPGSYDMMKLEEINKLMKISMPAPNIVDKLIKFNIFNKNICVEIADILKKVMNELNVLNFTNNEPPALSPLTKGLSNQNVGPKQSDILKVITPPFANDMFNYERMETYGDSFLKFATSLSLFDAYESENEGVLTELKMKLVGNRNLLYVGNKLNIGSYLKVNIFEPTMDWVPPCFVVPQKLVEIIEEGNLQSDVLHQIVIPREDQLSGKMSDETWVEIESEVLKFKKLSEMPISDSDDDDDDGRPQVGHSQSDLFINKQSVSDKMVADCVESLIGTYVYYLGVEGGFKLLHGLGIIPKEYIDSYKPKPNMNDLYKGLNFSHILPGYEILERRINYSFNHKHLLVQALTHPTHQFGFSECYQRLEFLGDAILDFLITTYIIEHCQNKTPGEITDIRSSLVNNITFASLSTRIGLHRFVLAESVELTNAIDRFFEHQQKNQHKIGQEVLYLIEENDCFAAESIDVPKVLGDLFESLIAAIYLDCGRDLNFVWKFCYRFMENEIKEFCTNVPKNPIRILHETKLQPCFSKPVASAKAIDRGLGTMIQLDIILNNKNMSIYGFGQNKKEAKVAAAKMALKNMKKMLS